MISASAAIYGVPGGFVDSYINGKKDRLELLGPEDYSMFYRRNYAQACQYFNAGTRAQKICYDR